MKLNIEKIPKKDFSKIYSIFLCVAFVFIGIIFYGRVLYIIDVSTDNKMILQTVLTELNGNNTGVYFINNDNQYRFPHDKQKTDYLEEYFVGRLCEIEYYKLSKSVTRITLLE